jgi:hypothetical protein
MATTPQLTGRFKSNLGSEAVAIEYEVAIHRNLKGVKEAWHEFVDIRVGVFPHSTISAGNEHPGNFQLGMASICPPAIGASACPSVRKAKELHRRGRPRLWANHPAPVKRFHVV